MLTEADAAKNLDVVIAVVHAIDGLVNDKFLPLELVLAGVKAALASLEGDKIATVSPYAVRAIAQQVRDDLAAQDAAKDAELKAAFDTSDSDVK